MPEASTENRDIHHTEGVAAAPAPSAIPASTTAPDRASEERREFLALCARELSWSEEFLRERLESTREERADAPPYAPSPAELRHGARVAWRNNARCIGRLFWSSLQVRDRRDLHRPAAVAEDLREHVRIATNRGQIRPLVTLYAPADARGSRVRIWNHQLFGYAGYGRQPDGSYLGDPKNETFTRLARELGWEGAGTRFDLLPWIIQERGRPPELFPLPEGLCLEVPLRHPRLSWFAGLGLRWYAVPILSDRNLRIGGADFPAAPFNGWYMGTEIGSRDLGDEGRYDVLPELLQRMDSPEGSSRERLAKDRALVELNEAVLHSFSEDGVRIVDHHRASSEFLRFAEKERQAGRLVSGRWSWLVPPLSGSATGVFHRGWKDRRWRPDYLPQTPAWEDAGLRG